MPCLAALVLGLFFSAPSPEAANQAVQRILEDSDYQSAFPGEDVRPPEREPPPPRKDLLDPLPFSGLVKVLMYVLIGVAVVLVVVALARRLGGYEADVAAPDATVSSTGQAAVTPASVLGDIEALAADGRFDEAIHVMLLRTLQIVGRRETLTGSLTSREIVREARLGEEARDAVERLVAAVEISLFGGRVPGEVDYRTSLDAYRRFATAYGEDGHAA